MFHDPARAPSLNRQHEQVTRLAGDRIAHAMYTWEPYMHNPKLRYRLHRINVPTLMLWGASDGMVPVAYAEAYRQMIPGATLVVIPDAGHLPHIEQPNVRCCGMSWRLWHGEEHSHAELVFYGRCLSPYLPDADTYESIRVSLPNKYYDPDKGADLYHMYLDLWCAADELGLEVMVNEHHQTATCVVPAAPIMLGILARQTKRARLLILGNPIANRSQLLRVAEEMAMIDVISRGRLSAGLYVVYRMKLHRPMCCCPYGSGCGKRTI